MPLTSLIMLKFLEIVFLCPVTDKPLFVLVVERKLQLRLVPKNIPEELVIELTFMFPNVICIVIMIYTL